MRTFTMTAGGLFALLTLVHLYRIALEGAHVLRDPWWMAVTLLALGMSVWAAVLLRQRRDAAAEPGMRRARH